MSASSCSFLCVLLVAAMAAVAFGRMAYVLPDGVDLLHQRNIVQSFDCAALQLPFGYYADVENECKIFHVCQPITDDFQRVIEIAQFSFICGNQTVFDQSLRTCQHKEDAIPCEASPSFFNLNQDFGRIEERRGSK